MKKHILKLNVRYESPKLEGKKPFEIRSNEDRDFKVGDRVRYKVVDDGDNVLESALSDKEFEIVFITDFMQRAGWRVFAEKEVKKCRK